MDFLVITYSIIDHFIKAFTIQRKTINAQAFTFVRSLRLAKIGKTLRVLKLIQSLH